VTLSGVVEWSFQKHNAEREISRLIGVTGVTNEIELKPSRKPVSAEIKTAAQT
jgi:osmotically-inducible protein OsmY